ncbi:MAG: phosphotransferase family protein [Pseudomonadota bacterium]
MDINALEEAALACLVKHDRRYAGARIRASVPVAGGYSRLTRRLELAMAQGQGEEAVVLQYLPPGSTGLVRVDRQVEKALLDFLSDAQGIDAPTLIAADMGNEFFDSVAYLFRAVPGRPFVELCREAEQTSYPALNHVLAGVAAQVQSIDLASLPDALERPADWTSYLDGQIESFREAEAQSGASRPFLRYLARWLDDNRPPEAPLSLVHGDFQAGNVIAPQDATANPVLVDWELAHIGDPREDLGWFAHVCGVVPPDLLATAPEAFYSEYRLRTGLSEAVVNPATVAYFLIISCVRTHYGMMKSSDALAQSAQQAQSALAAYYLSITTYQHTNWMKSIARVEEYMRKAQ